MAFLHSEQIPDPAPLLPESGPGLLRALWDVVETLLLAFVLFVGINAVSARIRVESISMQPNLYAGDFVIVNRLAYKLGQPQRGDVIVFRYPPDPEQTPYIKRVIGLPGDKIRILDGKVYVNEMLMAEPYLQSPTLRGGDWTVPAESLFVMGDNRNNSSDSRAWGMVPYINIIGRAEVIYWPPEDWGLLHIAAALAAPPYP